MRFLQFPKRARLLRLALVLRGLAAIVVSIAFYLLVRSYNGFFGFLGMHLIIGGALAAVASIGSYMEYKRGGRFLVDAIASLFSGFLIIVLALGANRVAFDVVFVLITIWAIIIGLAEIGAAVHLRKYIMGEKLLAAAGIISVLFAVGVYMRFLHFSLLLTMHGIIFGVLLLVLGLKLRSKDQRPIEVIAA